MFLPTRAEVSTHIPPFLRGFNKGVKQFPLLNIGEKSARV